MARLAEYLVLLLAAFSITLITAEYLYALTAQQLTILYILNAAIVAVLAADFINRAKYGWRRYFMRNSYEILALLPAFPFALLEQ